MTKTRHDKSKSPLFADDLQENPGIGQSKGSFATGESPAEIEGASTIEGDTENDATPSGGASERKLGRTNA
jgi:hypothetical protein